MAARIRLKKMGRKHLPFFRICVFDSHTKRDGKVIDTLGYYDPIAKDETKQLKLDEEKARHWLSVGAQPSATVRDFLAARGLYRAPSGGRNKRKTKSPEAKKANPMARTKGKKS